MVDVLFECGGEECGNCLLCCYVGVFLVGFCEDYVVCFVVCDIELMELLFVVNVVDNVLIM